MNWLELTRIHMSLTWIKIFLTWLDRFLTLIDMFLTWIDMFLTWFWRELTCFKMNMFLDYKSIMNFQCYYGIPVLLWNSIVVLEFQYYYGISLLLWNSSIIMEFHCHYGIWGIIKLKKKATFKTARESWQSKTYLSHENGLVSKNELTHSET